MKLTDNSHSGFKRLKANALLPLSTSKLLTIAIFTDFSDYNLGLKSPSLNYAGFDFKKISFNSIYNLERSKKIRLFYKSLNSKNAAFYFFNHSKINITKFINTYGNYLPTFGYVRIGNLVCSSTNLLNINYLTKYTFFNSLSLLYSNLVRNYLYLLTISIKY